MRADQDDAGDGRSPAERRHEAQELLMKFARAVTSGDGTAAASLWKVPAFVIEAEEADATPLSSLPEVQRLFSGSKQRYNERGIVDTRPEILHEERIGNRLILVKVRWPHLDAAGNELGAERSDYTLCRDEDGELRLRTALMRGVERPSERGRGEPDPRRT